MKYNLKLTNNIKLQYILKDTTKFNEKIIMDQITNGVRKTKI